MSVRQLLGYLRAVGALRPPAPAIVSDPVELMIGSFTEFLARERGLVDVSTVCRYQQTARRFLSGCERADGDGLRSLGTARVTGFVLSECSRGGRTHCRKSVVPGLRALLRFLYLEGLTENDLTSAVPSVAVWRGAALPKGLAAEDVRRMLASCDRRTPVGCRDFAILTVLARMGLRAGEVAALELGDIDWRAGEVLIRGKADRHERLPLPRDVGRALVDYLRRGRPDRQDPHLFLRALAPYGPTTRHAIGELVRSACRRAGLAPVGVHRLRHTVATETLRAGAPLEEIASLLRHRSTASTVTYAKVDFLRLRELARPWPGSLS
jgi:integrase/recombinase XerD